MIAAGTLRNRIRIDRAAKPWPKDAAGKSTPAWAEYCTRWARRRPLPLKTAESTRGDQVIALALVAYDMRRDSVTLTLTPDEQFRLVDGARYYDIKQVPPLEANEGTVTLWCEARAE